MKHWRIEDVDWSRFDPAKVDPEMLLLVKSAAMVERNGTEYAEYLARVFDVDPAFQQAAANWAVEEVQHGDALGRWASMADPGWDYMACFARYRAGYHINLGDAGSIRGSRAGELIARCIVETGTSSYYSALADTTGRARAAADLPPYREPTNFATSSCSTITCGAISRASRSVSLRRLRIAAGRVGETEDDELAFRLPLQQRSRGRSRTTHKRCRRGLPMGRRHGGLSVPSSSSVA